MLFRVWGCKNKTLTVASLIGEGTYEKDEENQAAKDRAGASLASRAGGAALLSGCFIPVSLCWRASLQRTQFYWPPLDDLAIAAPTKPSSIEGGRVSQNKTCMEL